MSHILVQPASFGGARFSVQRRHSCRRAICGTSRRRPAGTSPVRQEFGVPTQYDGPWGRLQPAEGFSPTCRERETRGGGAQAPRWLKPAHNSRCARLGPGFLQSTGSPWLTHFPQAAEIPRRRPELASTSKINRFTDIAGPPADPPGSRAWPANSTPVTPPRPITPPRSRRSAGRSVLPGITAKPSAA